MEVRPPGEGQGGEGAGGGGRGRRVEASGPAGGWLRALVDIGRTAEWDGLEAAALYGVDLLGWQIAVSQTVTGEGKGQARGHCTLQKACGAKGEVTRRARSRGAAKAAVYVAVLKRCLREVTEQGVQSSVEECELSGEGRPGAATTSSSGARTWCTWHSCRRGRRAVEPWRRPHERVAPAVQSTAYKVRRCTRVHAQLRS